MQPGPSPLIWVGFLAFFVVALVVGVRLLLLARRTRMLPELCIGIGVLGIGPVGFGASVAAVQLEGSSPGLASALMAFGSVGVAAGVCCKLVFNWRVYHAERRALAGLIAFAVAAFVVLFVVQALDGFPSVVPVNWTYYLRSSLMIGALLWGSAEALRYWGMMRRRVRIGLADPVVSNRFLLWGIGAFAAGFGSLVGNVVQVVTGVPSTEIPWVLASSSAHGMVAAVAMWLAFVPPPAYTRLIERRRAASA
jgi:hypothetical protein